MKFDSPIDKAEVLRYLGLPSQKLEASLSDLIDECLIEMQNVVTPRFGFKMFEIEHVNGQLFLKDANLALEGQSIFVHLKDCDKCFLMYATLGHECESLITTTQFLSQTKSFVLDSAATTAVEQVCDFVQLEIQNTLKPGQFLTSRFSAGYGDFPLTLQKQLLLLSGGSKHISLSDTFLMSPRKSVTAILGVSNRPPLATATDCTQCNLCKSCQHKKDKSC